MLLHSFSAPSCNIRRSLTYHSPLISTGLQSNCGYVSNVEQLSQCQYHGPAQVVLAGGFFSQINSSGCAGSGSESV